MVEIGTTKCKWDSIIPFDRYIVVKEGKRYKTLYKDEFMLRKFKEGINIKEAEKEWKENSKEGMWEKINKLIKPNGAIVLFGSEPFSSALRMSNIKNYKYDWYWRKEKGKGHLNAKKMPLKSVETISIFYKKSPTYNPQFVIGEPYKKINCSKNKLNKGIYGKTKESYNSINTGIRYPKTDLFFTSVQRTLHPTQKPVALLEYLIKTYTNEGELILDFTMGSGSTRSCCIKY